VGKKFKILIWEICPEESGLRYLYHSQSIYSQSIFQGNFTGLGNSGIMEDLAFKYFLLKFPEISMAILISGKGYRFNKTEGGIGPKVRKVLT